MNSFESETVCHQTSPLLISSEYKRQTSIPISKSDCSSSLQHLLEHFLSY